MSRLRSVIIVALAVAAVGILIAITAHNWEAIGNTGISVYGWIALALGVLVTLALGVGLMALVFISNRRGYDDR